MTEDPVIRGVLAAVEADPENASLRLHLAQLQLGADQYESALENARVVLSRSPADLDALSVACDAALAAGDAEASEAYAKLLAGLRAGKEPAPRQAITGLGDPFAGDAGEVAEDESLDEGFERPAITLDDVGGLDAVKRRLNASFLAPLANPELTAAYGKSLRGGLLLYGPPGCGKSHVARALAGELGAKFASVGISDILDMYLGESERKLHETFESARRMSPCVLFLDEVDALGQKRSHLRGSAGRGVVNQLLAEMDAVDSNNEGLFVLAATNHPWDVDTALRRPGRFDRMLLVLPPDEGARKAILELHLRERPVEADLGLARLAKKTSGYSGADLAYVCEVATERALEDSIETGEVRPISSKDLEAASREVNPSTRAWFDVAYNYAMFANEGGQYDDLLAYIREHKLK